MALAVRLLVARAVYEVSQMIRKMMFNLLEGNRIR
jgi:hypothetical protein